MTNLTPVLTWVNQEREKRGMEPLERLPKGQRKRSDRCPLAVALDADVDDATWTPVDGDLEALPYLAQDFVWGFDNGKYPELVA